MPHSTINRVSDPHTSNPALSEAIAYLLETDRLKTVTRKIRVRSADPAPSPLPEGHIPFRQENSAEHSWQLALFATVLAPFAAASVDLPRVLEMLLLHDLGEIDTGDTMAFVEGGWAERKRDERAAAERIFALLPAAQATRNLALWDEFESGDTPDARFANAIDRATPPLLNLSNGGGSWVEHGISHSRVVARIRDQVQAGSPALWQHLEAELQRAADNGWFNTALNS